MVETIFSRTIFHIVNIVNPQSLVFIYNLDQCNGYFTYGLL